MVLHSFPHFPNDCVDLHFHFYTVDTLECGYNCESVHKCTVHCFSVHWCENTTKQTVTLFCFPWNRVLFTAVLLQYVFTNVGFIRMIVQTRRVMKWTRLIVSGIDSFHVHICAYTKYSVHAEITNHWTKVHSMHSIVFVLFSSTSTVSIDGIGGDSMWCKWLI